LAALASVLPDRHAVLRTKAESFLDRKAVGWRGNFRNLDDALKYQDIWNGSALAIARYRDDLSPSLIKGLPLAVEWVKQQMPVAPLHVNYGVPGISKNIDTLAIGAFLAHDPEAKWLLDRQLERIRDGDSKLTRELNALWLWDDNQPSRKPAFSSTIIQGPTGYSFRPGALAPDKLVLRNEVGAAEWYLLANLRNQGWHRYPATNAVIRIVYGARQLIAENVRLKMHHWLPKGRAVHRDKKIDRANLNGLQIERTGLDAWIGAVTGIYSRWRQDVPRFATAQSIKVVGDLQLARSDIVDWDDVSQRRLFALDGKNGTLVIIDRATGDEGIRKAVHWHLVDMKSRSGDSWTGDCPDGLCQIDILPLQPGKLSSEKLDNTGRYSHPDAVPNQRVRVETSAAELAAAIVIRKTSGNVAAYRVSAVNDRHGQALGVSIAGGESEQIFIAGKAAGWAIDGLESDAEFIRLRRAPQMWHLEYFGVTVLDIATPEWACNVRWMHEGKEQITTIEPLDRPRLNEQWLAPRDGALSFLACP